MNFLLVHGACHGAWCWTRVSSRLRAGGHDVQLVTLTGTGERAHLASSEVGLETMVQDVVAVAEAEELHDAVLVGHSFGALVCLAAADRVGARLRGLVLVDGIVVDPGSCAMDALPAETARARVAEGRHDGLLRPMPAAAYGVTDPDDQAWVERHLTPHPLRSYTDPFMLMHRPGNGLPVTYIACTNPRYAPLASSLRIVQEHGWPVTELATGHDAMITAAQELTALLVASAAAGAGDRRQLPGRRGPSGHLRA